MAVRGYPIGLSGKWSKYLLYSDARRRSQSLIIFAGPWGQSLGHSSLVYWGRGRVTIGAKVVEGQGFEFLDFPQNEGPPGCPQFALFEEQSCLPRMVKAYLYYPYLGRWLFADDLSTYEVASCTAPTQVETDQKDLQKEAGLVPVAEADAAVDLPIMA